jgi:hypothetical protein
MTEHLRWIAIVTYRGEAGPIEVDHHFEELEELHTLIEHGPHFDTIISNRRHLQSGARGIS